MGSMERPDYGNPRYPAAIFATPSSRAITASTSTRRSANSWGVSCDSYWGLLVYDRTFQSGACRKPVIVGRSIVESEGTRHRTVNRFASRC